jgi:hypothetical protein
MRVEIPEQARTLAVLAPRDAGESFDGWSIGDGQLRSFGGPVHARSGGTFELRLHPVGKTDPAVVPAPPWSPWPVLRRAATELRDRTLPLRPTRLL